MVSSLFDRISTCRIARPSLDARSGTNVVGLIPHFYFTPDGKYIEWTGTYCVNALSGLYLISTNDDVAIMSLTVLGVNALSGLYLISTMIAKCQVGSIPICVSMPSRAYTSFLLKDGIVLDHYSRECVNALSGLYLISTQYLPMVKLSQAIKCQCPLGLIPHFYNSYLVSELVLPQHVSMPSRAYTSFLRYPFKNLGFMRFPEPVFAGIYQNILTTTVFRAC